MSTKDGIAFGDGYPDAYWDAFDGRDGNGLFFRHGKRDGQHYDDGKGVGDGHGYGFGRGYRTGDGKDTGYEEIQKRITWELRHREIIEGKPMIG